MARNKKILYRFRDKSNDTPSMATLRLFSILFGVLGIVGSLVVFMFGFSPQLGPEKDLRQKKRENLAVKKILKIKDETDMSFNTFQEVRIFSLKNEKIVINKKIILRPRRGQNLHPNSSPRNLLSVHNKPKISSFKHPYKLGIFSRRLSLRFMDINVRLLLRLHKLSRDLIRCPYPNAFLQENSFDNFKPFALFGLFLPFRQLRCRNSLSFLLLFFWSLLLKRRWPVLRCFCCPVTPF